MSSTMTMLRGSRRKNPAEKRFALLFAADILGTEGVHSLLNWLCWMKDYE